MSYALLPERTLRLLSLRGKRYLPKGKKQKFQRKWHTNLRMSFFLCNFATEFAKVHENGAVTDYT